MEPAVGKRWRFAVITRSRRDGGYGMPPSAYDIYMDRSRYLGHTIRETYYRSTDEWRAVTPDGLRSPRSFGRHVDATAWLADQFWRLAGGERQRADRQPPRVPVRTPPEPIHGGGPAVARRPDRRESEYGADLVKVTRQSRPQVRCTECKDFMMVGWDFSFAAHRNDLSPCCGARIEEV